MGLAYVHSVKIIHRDVKVISTADSHVKLRALVLLALILLLLQSLNVLITRDMVAKLTDFGASTIMAPTMSQGIGSIMWMAPEVLHSKDYSEKADIYSFGIVLWEILERDLPYPNMRSYQIEKYVLDKKRYYSHDFRVLLCIAYNRDAPLLGLLFRSLVLGPTAT